MTERKLPLDQVLEGLSEEDRKKIAPFGFKADGQPRRQSPRKRVEPFSKEHQPSPEARSKGTRKARETVARTRSTWQITAEQKRKFWERIDAGYSIRRSAQDAGFSYGTGLRIHGEEFYLHESTQEVKAESKLKGPMDRDQLCSEAQRALQDFAYFQRRYFGRIATPWQEEAAEVAIRLLESEEEEYLVVNAPPGSGKSTLFTLDLCAWITCRNRSVRGLIGSRTMKQASWYVGRLRRALERTIPDKAEAMELARGRALDAEATLAEDFGRFRPLDRELWTADQFIVMQLGGGTISEKEATWSAFGMDSGFLGGRYDIVIWDDVVDPSKTKTQEQIEYQREWWNDYAETRLEPGGLCILQGQRIGAEDLYRYCLDMRVPKYLSEEDEVEEVDDDAEFVPKYKHVVFKAHYDEKCLGAINHKISSPPYPEGCLLYPRRLSWKKLATIMENRKERFRVLYQQEDVDPEDVLVNPAWIYGNNQFPGCLDKDRDILDLPRDARSMLSVVSCDPSPANNWAVEWWLYHEPSELRFLIDLYRGRMDAPQFLDFDYKAGKFTGIMEEWQATSVRLGVPITHWIVEINAAQRFLLQYDHVQRWKARWGAEIVPHSTTRNKIDPEYGVDTIAPHYQFGRVRLPAAGAAYMKSERLIREVTRYSKGNSMTLATDDCVMAHWFFEWQLPHIKGTKNHKVARQWRPTWR